MAGPEGLLFRIEAEHGRDTSGAGTNAIVGQLTLLVRYVSC